MNIQSLSVVVPNLHCINHCAFCVSCSVVDESDYIITLEAAEDRKHVGKNVVVKVISDSLKSEATMTLQIINW